MSFLTRSNIRFRKGLRVKNNSFMAQYQSGIPVGLTGTVAEVAGVRGKSIWCDPTHMMVFVEWDNGLKRGVFKGELAEVK